MALKIPVKVNMVNNLTDARYCAGMGVSMIGFYMEENMPNALSTQKVLELTSWISGIDKVGEFDNTTPGKAIDIAKTIELDYVQFNRINPAIKDLQYPIIQKLLIENENLEHTAETIKEYAPYVKYFLIESEVYLLVELAKYIQDWQKLAPIILGFGINNDNLDLILNELKPSGISINGGNEIRPGYKDLDELIDLLEALEVED